MFVGWRLCDDSRVSSISHEKNVVTRGAYLLFYRRRQTFLPPPSIGLASGQSDEDEDFQSVHCDTDDGFESKGEGRLVIDTSPSTEELPDLDGNDVCSGAGKLSKRPQQTDDDNNVDDDGIGYTDMDAVD